MVSGLSGMIWTFTSTLSANHVIGFEKRDILVRKNFVTNYNAFHCSTRLVYERKRWKTSREMICWKIWMPSATSCYKKKKQNCTYFWWHTHIDIVNINLKVTCVVESNLYVVHWSAGMDDRTVPAIFTEFASVAILI
jgi:hypothetical protein